VQVQILKRVQEIHIDMSLSTYSIARAIIGDQGRWPLSRKAGPCQSVVLMAGGSSILAGDLLS
jgi:hypothetical protein